MPSMTDTMQKGVLDSIKSMFRGGRPERGNTGPTTTIRPSVTPSAPAPFKLSGRADDHGTHAQGITHLLQTRALDDQQKAALTHLRSAHENLEKAHAAYQSGNLENAHRYALGAKAFLHHAQAAHPHTVAFHGDTISHKLHELSHGINGTPLPVSMAKADGAGVMQKAEDAIAEFPHLDGGYMHHEARARALDKQGWPAKAAAHRHFAGVYSALDAAEKNHQAGNIEAAKQHMKSVYEHYHKGHAAAEDAGMNPDTHLHLPLRYRILDTDEKINGSPLAKAAPPEAQPENPYEHMVMGLYRSR